MKSLNRRARAPAEGQGHLKMDKVTFSSAAPPAEGQEHLQKGGSPPEGQDNLQKGKATCVFAGLPAGGQGCLQGGQGYLQKGRVTIH